LNEHLTFAAIVMRVGMSCAQIAVGAAGIFVVIRFFAGTG
jgi:hypothetical protein